MFGNKASSYRLPATISLVAFIAYSIVAMMRYIDYTQDIGGHLKLAADSNTTELATEQLQIAVDGIEKHGLCSKDGDCFTSVIYRTPDEDVGFWRRNIEITLADLKDMSKEERDDNLIESNTLIKVRETLMDSSQGGDIVTDPAGIIFYPSNTGFAAWGFGSSLLLCFFGFLVLRDEMA